MMKHISRYQWKPDLPDFRDHVFATPAGTVLPPHVDLRPHCSPLEDQGSLGSCTGNAIVGAMEYLENVNGTSFVDLSRLFVYYNERVIEGTVKSDAGAEIRDGIKAVARLGVCTEAMCKYTVSRFTRKPSKRAYTNGMTRVITEYMRITNLADMQGCLATGNPFVFGFTVYDSFESDEVARTGKVPMPTKTNKVVGGHAVLAVGYDDATHCVIVRNSWGNQWGDGGYFYMPYDYISNTNLCDDMWMIKK